MKGVCDVCYGDRDEKTQLGPGFEPATIVWMSTAKCESLAGIETLEKIQSSRGCRVLLIKDVKTKKMNFIIGGEETKPENKRKKNSDC